MSFSTFWMVRWSSRTSSSDSAPSALIFVEIFVLWLPIAYHAILGVYFARSGKSNTDRYGYQANRYQVHPGQWMVTLGAKWNLFDGGVVGHRANAVERQAAALTEQRDELASLIALQVRQTWLDVQETRKRLIVTQSTIAQAEENLLVARDRYANGLSTRDIAWATRADAAYAPVAPRAE